MLSEITEVLVKRELNWFKYNLHQLKAVTVMKMWKVDNRMFIDNEKLVCARLLEKVENYT
jgi:hypothetical protein